TPKVVRAVVPARPPDPRDCAPDVFDDQWHAGLRADADSRLKEAVQILDLAGAVAVLALPLLGEAPRHRHVAVFLAGRRGADQRSVLELPPVKRAHVLQHELRRIAVLAILMALNVKADHIVALGQHAIRPAAQTAEQIDA